MRILQKISSVLFAFLVVFSFTSCQKDGVFNPKNKIHKVYEVLEDGKYLCTQYEWDGDLMIRAFSSDSTIMLYNYNAKKQLESIMGSDNSYISIEYDDNKIEDVTYYEENEKILEIEYERKGGKIVSAELQYYDIPLIEQRQKEGNKLFETMIHTFVPCHNNMFLSQLCKYGADSKGQDIKAHVNFEWEGKNLARIEMTAPILIYTVKMICDYKYDNNNNPFNQSWSNAESGLAGDFVYNWMMVHNPVEASIIMQAPGISSREVNKYTYTYNKNKYPTQVDITTLDSENTYSTSYEYEYLAE